jgi:hypothetical protein
LTELKSYKNKGGCSKNEEGKKIKKLSKTLEKVKIKAYILYKGRGTHQPTPQQKAATKYSKKGRNAMNGYKNTITWEMSLYMNNEDGIYNRIKGDDDTIGKEEILEILSNHLDWDDMENNADWKEVFEVVKEIQETA